MTILPQEKRHAFKKDIYLLGEEEDGTKIWLEAPSWDCGWYWGFGYIETFTNNKNPEKSRDIDSHSHVDTSLLGKGNAKDGGCCHNIFNAQRLAKTTFDEKTGWTLTELFKQFYLLKESAALFGAGDTNTSPIKVKPARREAWAKEINEKIIPEVTAAILALLTPRE